MDFLRENRFSIVAFFFLSIGCTEQDNFSTKKMNQATKGGRLLHSNPSQVQVSGVVSRIGRLRRDKAKRRIRILKLQDEPYTVAFSDGESNPTVLYRCVQTVDVHMNGGNDIISRMPSAPGVSRNLDGGPDNDVFALSNTTLPPVADSP